MRALRNIAIIAALAFIVAAVPGGGEAAEAVLTAITITFLATIALAGFQIYRSQRLAIMTLTDQQRLLLCAALGVVILMIAGADEMLETGLGTLAWIGLIAAAAVAIWRLYLESQTY